MRPCVRYLMAAANLLAARPHEVSSLATMDILNSGLNCAASGSAGKRPAVTMRRKAAYFMATSSCSMRLHINTLAVRRRFATTNSRCPRFDSEVRRFTLEAKSTWHVAAPLMSALGSVEPTAKSRHSAVQSPAPLYPQERTFGSLIQRPRRRERLG